MAHTPIPFTLLETYRSDRAGYQALADSSTWRVGLLNYEKEFSPDGICELQRHNESDELFVILVGECVLFIGEGEETVTQILAQKLEPFTCYLVKRRAWHAHVLSQDGKVLIVENLNTSRANSPRLQLTSSQRAEMSKLAHQLLNAH